MATYGASILGLCRCRVGHGSLFWRWDNAKFGDLAVAFTDLRAHCLSDVNLGSHTDTDLRAHDRPDRARAGHRQPRRGLGQARGLWRFLV